MKRFVQLAALLVLAAWVLPAWGEETRVVREGNHWVQVTTGWLPAARNLKVATEVGSVTVRGGGGSRISYAIRKRAFTAAETAARRSFDSFHFKAFHQADFAVIQGECPGMPGVARVAVDIIINTPRDMSAVKVVTLGGGVTVNNIAGSVQARTSGGSISMNDIGGTISAHTSGGGIDIGNAVGDVTAESAGGSIVVRQTSGKVLASTAGGSIEIGSAHLSADLRSAGGSIQVQKVGGPLRANTAGGSVDVGAVGGPAVLETEGGSIRLDSANGTVRARTSGGGIRLRHLTHGAIARTSAGPIIAEFVAQKDDFSDSLLETSVGDVVVYLPSHLPVTVRASIEAAMGHSIRSEFPDLQVNSEGSGFGVREIFAQGNINGGGPVLRIHAISGNIVLHRGSK